MFRGISVKTGEVVFGYYIAVYDEEKDTLVHYVTDSHENRTEVDYDSIERFTEEYVRLDPIFENDTLLVKVDDESHVGTVIFHNGGWFFSDLDDKYLQDDYRFNEMFSRPLYEVLLECDTLDFYQKKC